MRLLDDISAGPTSPQSVSGLKWSTRTHPRAWVQHREWTKSGGPVSTIHDILAGIGMAGGIGKLADEGAAADDALAADSAGSALTIDTKIAGQMGERGWTPQSINDMVGGATQKYPVWDYTSGSAEPATAYATSDNAYLVVNDATGKVVQISNTHQPDWQPPWQIPRFQRDAG